MLAIAAHSLGEMLMPNQYLRSAGEQPAVIEIAFLTRDVPASFAKAIAERATPITPPRRMPWGLEVAYVRTPRWFLRTTARRDGMNSRSDTSRSSISATDPTPG